MKPLPPIWSKVMKETIKKYQIKNQILEPEY